MRRLLGAFATAIGFAALVGAASAGATPSGGSSGEISEVHASAGRLQFVFSADNLATGQTLNPASVQVSANGQALQAVAGASTAQGGSAATLPSREVMLTLDTSGSMQGNGIAAARAAALTYSAGLPPDVRLGLVTFSDAPHLLVAPTTDRGRVASAIAGVTAGGDTSLYDGIVTAVRAMATAPPGTDKRLVILSDGDDTKSRLSITDAIGALNGNRVAADVVAFRLPGNQTALDQLASSSNGRVLPAANAGELAGAFVIAAQAFRQQVLITVDVPAPLSGRQVTLTASMSAGAQTFSASTTALLPVVVTAPALSHQAVETSVKAPSAAMLYLVLGVAFAVLLILALLMLWFPATSAERAAKQDRLAEVGRYRVVETLGRAANRPALAPTESNLTKATLSLADRAVRAGGKRQGLVDELDRAGMRIRPEEWAVLQVCAVVISGAAVAVLATSLIGLFIGGALGWVACRVYVHSRTTRRIAKFEAQLPDMLQLVAGSLRSGFSLNQAIAGVVSEGTEPAASEFARALTEVRLGSELEDALDDVAERMKCLDLRLVVMAIRISREVGGNLAEVLLTTVATMRERAQLRGQVKVLSAEGRLSAKVLIGLPFLLAGYLAEFRPDYLRPLVSTGPGIAILALAVVELVVGSFWLSRLVKIEV